VSGCNVPKKPDLLREPFGAEFALFSIGDVHFFNLGSIVFGGKMSLEMRDIGKLLVAQVAHVGRRVGCFGKFFLLLLDSLVRRDRLVCWRCLVCCRCLINWHCVVHWHCLVHCLDCWH